MSGWLEVTYHDEGLHAYIVWGPWPPLQALLLTHQVSLGW
jgi:hypothetical protein